MYQSVCRSPSPWISARVWVCVSVCFCALQLQDEMRGVDDWVLWKFSFRKPTAVWLTSSGQLPVYWRDNTVDLREAYHMDTRLLFELSAAGLPTQKLNNWSTSWKDPESGWIIVHWAAWAGRRGQTVDLEDSRNDPLAVIIYKVYYKELNYSLSTLETFRSDSAIKVLNTV